MKVKRSLKKIGAIAGSTLIVGMTMGSAASLAEFPQPFVKQDGTVASTIVVGSQGKVADVVGAIDIAASVGQRAVSTTTRAADSTTAVDGKRYTVDIRTNSLTDEWIDKSGYSRLRRATVTDAEGTEHRVLEQIGVDPDGAGQEIGHTVNGSATVATVDQGAIEYTVSYTPGFGVGDTVSILGQDYEVTGITDDGDGNRQLSLGSKEARDGLELGDTYDHGPYTVEVVDKDESSSAIYVEIRKEGETLKSAGLQTGNTTTVKDGAFTVTADDVFFGSKRDYIDVHSVHTDTTVVEGEDAPFDADYTVKALSGSGYTADADSGTVTGVTLENDRHTTASDPAETDDADDISRLTAGDVFGGPAGYFEFVFQGLTAEATEEVAFTNDAAVTFTDPNGLNQSVTMKDVFTAQGLTGSESGTAGAADDDGNRYAIDVSGVSTGSSGAVDVSYQGWQGTIAYEGKDFTDNTVTTASNKLGAAPDVATADLKVSNNGQGQQNLYSPSDNVVANNTQGSMTLAGFSGVSDLDYTNTDVSVTFDISPGSDSSTVNLISGTSTSQTVNGGAGSTTVSLSLTGQDLETNDVQVQVSDSGSSSASPGATTIDTDVEVNVSGVNTSAATGQGESVSLSFSTDGTQLGDYGTGTSSGFNLYTDQRYAKVFSTGYGFDIGAEFVNTVEGSTTGTDRINLGSGTTEETVQYGAQSVFTTPTTARLSTGFGAELRYTDAYINSDGATVDAVTVDEAAGDSDVGTTEQVHVAYDDTTGDDYADADTGEPGEIEFSSGLGTAPSDLTDTEGAATVTNFGSAVELEESSQASVTYPDVRRNARFVLGALSSEGTGDAYQTIDEDAQGSLPPMAMLDSDVTDSVKMNNNLILVGGPAVNTLVADLADSGAVSFSELEGQSSGALLQTVDNAFAEGQDALVVAGVGAADTQSAAQYVANYASHQERLAEVGERLVLAEADYPSEQ